MDLSKTLNILRTLSYLNVLIAELRRVYRGIFRPLSNIEDGNCGGNS